MKKILLFTVSIFLIFSMIGCPTTVNRGPSFNRLLVDSDGDESIVKLQSLTANRFETDRDAVIKSGGTFDYKEKYGPEYIIYEHVRGDDFHPRDMLNELIQEQNIIAVDYKQDYVEVGANRDYIDISENILLTSFYDIWIEGDLDGEGNEIPDELLGQFRTDINGDYVFDNGKIRSVERKSVGSITEFSLYVEDEDGAQATINGLIIIID